MIGRLCLSILFFLSFGLAEANPLCKISFGLLQSKNSRMEKWQRIYADAEKADDKRAGQLALAELMKIRPDILGLKGWISNFWSRRYVRQLASAHEENFAMRTHSGVLDSAPSTRARLKMILKDIFWSQAPFLLRGTGLVSFGADRVRDRLLALTPEQIKELTGSPNQSYFLNLVSGWFGPQKTPSKFIRKQAIERLIRTLAISTILGMTGYSPLLLAENAIQEPKVNFAYWLHSKAGLTAEQKNVLIVNLDSEMKPAQISKKFESFTAGAANTKLVEAQSLADLDRVIGENSTVDIVLLNIRSAPGIFQMSETFVAPWTEIPEFKNHLKPGSTVIFAGNQFADIPIEMRDDEPWIKISRQVLDPKSGQAIGFVNDLRFERQGFPDYLKSTLLLPVQTSYGARHLNMAGPVLWNQIPQIYDGQTGLRIFSQESNEAEFKSAQP